MDAACSAGYWHGSCMRKKSPTTGSGKSVKSGPVLGDEDLNRGDEGGCVGTKIGEEECLQAKQTSQATALTSPLLHRAS